MCADTDPCAELGSKAAAWATLPLAAGFGHWPCCGWRRRGRAGPKRPTARPRLFLHCSAGPERWTSPEGLSSTLQVLLLMTVISLAPAVLLMTTCFVRIIVVLGLLRQALGTQQLPPSQVITFDHVVFDAAGDVAGLEASLRRRDRALHGADHRTGRGLDRRRAPGAAIHECPDRADRQQPGHLVVLQVFAGRHRLAGNYDDVPLAVLLPAFMLSELKTSFLIGFQIYLPFMVLDIVIASVMISMGMMMLPPVLISLPFKLLLFVLVDGWHLVVGTLLESFQPFG